MMQCEHTDLWLSSTLAIKIKGLKNKPQKKKSSLSLWWFDDESSHPMMRCSLNLALNHSISNCGIRSDYIWGLYIFRQCLDWSQFYTACVYIKTCHPHFLSACHWRLLFYSCCLLEFQRYNSMFWGLIYLIFNRWIDGKKCCCISKTITCCKLSKTEGKSELFHLQQLLIF